MKRIIAIILITVLALSISACGTSEPKEAKAESLEGVFQVGYGRGDISPTESVPLAGRGNTSGGQWSENVMDPLYLTCIALKDVNGSTILMFTGDTISPDADVFVDALRHKVSNETGVPYEQVTYTATHSHSTVDMTKATYYECVARYNQMVLDTAVTTAQQAIADLAPAQVSAGTTETENLNFTRHYIQADGTYAGDGFGTWLDSDPVQHVRQCDTTMYVVRFARENSKDIVLVNWRAHPGLTTSGLNISADYVGSFREAFEAQYDAHFAYYQGASGDVNASSRIEGEKRALDYKEHGNLLAQYAIECLESNMTDIAVEDVQYEYINYTANVNHAKDHMLIDAKIVQSYRQTLKDYFLVKPIAEEYGFHSMYEATFVIQRAAMPETQDVPLGVMAIGDELAIVLHCGEMFNQVSEQLAEKSPYKYTLWFSYCFDAQGYWPSDYAWEYECYGTDTSLYERGTSELVRDMFLEKLNEMKEG